jgi:adenosylcobinamide kinase/adenosylcobinamide-phosphate guanylyltransferase
VTVVENNRLILITGGCRSGKSEYAEQLAREAGLPVFYLATAVITDPEMEKRVVLHKKRRPSSWQTIEEPLELPQAVRSLHDQKGLLLVDSLSGCLANQMYSLGQKEGGWDQQKEKTILDMVKAFLSAVRDGSCSCLVVSDEVGWGLVPDTAEGRFFRDLNGKANQMVARAAQQVFLVVAGIPVPIK